MVLRVRVGAKRYSFEDVSLLPRPESLNKCIHYPVLEASDFSQKGHRFGKQVNKIVKVKADVIRKP